MSFVAVFAYSMVAMVLAAYQFSVWSKSKQEQLKSFVPKWDIDHEKSENDVSHNWS